MRIVPTVLCIMLSAFSVAAEGPGGVQARPVEISRQLIESGKSDDALRILEGYKPSQDELSSYHDAYGRALEQKGRPGDSIEHYRLAYLYAKKAGEKETLLLRRSEAYIRTGFNSEAALCLEVFLRNFPKSQRADEARLSLADLRFSLGQFRGALNNYDMAGTSSRALYGKANSLQALGMYKDAQDIYLSLVRKDRAFLESSEETKYNVAENLRMTGNIADAKTYFNSIQNPALKPSASLSLGLIALDEGSYDQAVPYFDSASKSGDRKVRSRALLGSAKAYIGLGKSDDAVSLLIEARNANPYGGDYGSATLLLVKAYRTKGMSDEAVSLLKELAFRQAPDPVALDELEELLSEALSKDRDEFIKLWKAVGQWMLHPSRTGTLVRFAEGLNGAGRPMLEVCKWLLKYGKVPDKDRALLLLAGFHADIGDAPTAARHLSGISKSGQDDDYHRVSAKVGVLKGDAPGAASELMAVRGLREEDLLLLFDAAAYMKNAGSVIVFAGRAFGKIPGTVRSYVRYADLLYRSGKKSEARRYYEAAASAAPTDAQGSDLKETEWAKFRLASLSPGSGSAGLKSGSAGKGAANRLSEADVRASELSKKAREIL